MAISPLLPQGPCHPPLAGPFPANNRSLTNTELLFQHKPRQVINRSSRAFRSFTASPLAPKSHTGRGSTLDCRRPSNSGAQSDWPQEQLPCWTPRRAPPAGPRVEDAVRVRLGLPFLVMTISTTSSISTIHRALNSDAFIVRHWPASPLLVAVVNALVGVDGAA